MTKETEDIEPNLTNNVYETDASLNMYLGLHYPSSGNGENVAPILPHENSPLHGLRFPQRVAELLVRLKPEGYENALDIGCAVGGSSFELARTFGHVDAFDHSESFIQAAERMKAHEQVVFRVPVEADLHETVVAVHEEGVTQDITSKVEFFVGDACNIPKMIQDGRLSTYDGVILSNLVCRLPDPLVCLKALSEIVRPGGVVVMVTPFSWLDEFTPREKWLGGYYESGKAITSKDTMRQIMEEIGFERIHEEQIPLIIREHQRKYQYIISEATGWRRTAR
jgi:putative 4-mercaptohistidine N1-methyltranferase